MNLGYSCIPALLGETEFKSIAALTENTPAIHPNSVLRPDLNAL